MSLLAFEVECEFCHKPVPILMTSEQNARYTRPNRDAIQDIFPEMDAAARQVLSSGGPCATCWTKLFGPKKSS